MIKYGSMDISVIIPTLNAGVNIERLLSLLRAQGTKPSEIIIIDSSSEDNTLEVAKRFDAKAIVIPRNEFNHGRTRNAAAKEAKGGLLVFMTQDAVPVDNNLLRKLIAPLMDPSIAASYGRHVPMPDASPLERFARQFNYPEVKLIKGMADIKEYGIKTFFFSNVCSAIKKEVFIKVGLFPENITVNEDMLIAAKLMAAGYKTAYVPEAVVMHSHNYSFFQTMRRYYNIGLSLKRNRWVFTYARAEGEGLRFVREEIKFVLKERRYAWLPHIFLEAFAKYAGYRLGAASG